MDWPSRGARSWPETHGGRADPFHRRVLHAHIEENDILPGRGECALQRDEAVTQPVTANRYARPNLSPGPSVSLETSSLQEGRARQEGQGPLRWGTQGPDRRLSSRVQRDPRAWLWCGAGTATWKERIVASEARKAAPENRAPWVQPARGDGRGRAEGTSALIAVCSSGKVRPLPRPCGKPGVGGGGGVWPSPADAGPGRESPAGPGHRRGRRWPPAPLPGGPDGPGLPPLLPARAPGFPPPPPADIIVRPPRRKQPLCQICTCDKKVAEFASPLSGVVLYENVVVSTLTSYFQPSAQGNTTYGSIPKELRVEAPSKPSQMFHADWRGVKAFQSSAVTGASCQLLALSISACA